MVRVVLALLKPAGTRPQSGLLSGPLQEKAVMEIRRHQGRGRTHYLKKVYRNTKAIFDLHSAS